MKYTKHRFNIFPEMQIEDFERLKNDLSANGYDVKQPIYLYNKEVLDGWNRQKACDELNIIPFYKDFIGNDSEAIGFVMRTNKRRNLNSSQWACIAAEADELIHLISEQVEKERREKISERENVGNQYRKVETVQLIVPSAKDTTKLAAAKIAETFNTNRTYVSEATKLKETKPEVFEQVKSGAKTLTEVKKEAKKANFEYKKSEFEKPIEKINKNQIIIYGDSIKILPTLKKQSFDLLLTDPPYGMDFKSGWSDKDKIANDKIKDTVSLFEDVLRETLPLLKDDAHFYIFGSIDYVGELRPIIEKHLNLKNILIWDRKVIGMGDLKSYGKSFDVIYFGYNKKWKDLNGTRDRDVLSFNRVDPSRNIHPTEKPTDLLEYLIKKSTDVMDNILDPFAGGGSTLIACKNTNRTATGIEIESKYYELIKDRI